MSVTPMESSVTINLTVTLQDDDQESLIVNLTRTLLIAWSILKAIGKAWLTLFNFIGDFSQAVKLSLADLRAILPKPNFGVIGKLMSILFNSLAYAMGVIK